MPFRKLLKKLHDRRAPAVWVEHPVPPALWAVGDVHGRVDLYDRLEAMIRRRTPQATVVLLGDLIDRGPQSRQVIARMLAPDPAITRLAILGNHEDMALRFLDHPESAERWLTHGGAEALADWGITRMPGESVTALRNRWQDVLGWEEHAFLRALPLGRSFGSHVLTHAGAAAEVPLRAQGKAELVWQRHGEIADLLPPADLGERIVVHGHVPVEHATVHGWRINLDTGAWKSGRLSAARLQPGRDPELLVVE
jgi:serine/threonine protein phosphatase 1